MGQNRWGRFVKIFFRGEIWLVDFEPARENEVNKTRPAIIITNNTANQFGTTLMVIPLTSNTNKIFPFQVLLPAEETGLDYDSKAQVEQMRAVGIARMQERLGKVDEVVLGQLENRIKLHLGFG